MPILPTRQIDWCPLDYLIPAAEWIVLLDPTNTQVRSKLTITPNPDGVSNQPIRLNGVGLILESCKMDGRPVEPIITPTGIELPPTRKPIDIELVTRCNPTANTALEGLYWVDGVYCTQNEPEGLRRISYFIDRPDQLTRFTITLVAPKSCPYLLANGNQVAKGEWDDTSHFVTWEDPFPKPSYLVAMVAGHFDCIQDEFTTRSGRTVQLEIYTDLGTANRCWHAMNSLKRAMKWDETVYQREYDLERFMIVATQTFNMGAMENTGLNIFNAAYVHYDVDTATDTDYLNVERVIAHEYFHHWTGNRVTCRDWFQLTLKEGLTVYRDQSFSGDMNSNAVQRIADVVQLVERQFEEDAGPMAHPIQPASYIEINNFYTATVYEKGAEIIRMMALLADANTPKIGAGFMNGVQIYFNRHTGQAVTTESWIRAIEDGAGIDLSQFRRWYHQAGTPHLSIQRLHSDADQHTYQLIQTCRDTPETVSKQPFVIPVLLGFVSHQGHALPFRVGDGPECMEQLISIQDEQTILSITVEPEAVPSWCRTLSAPITWSYPYTQADYHCLMKSDSDPVNRYMATTHLVTQAINNPHIQPTDLLNTIDYWVTNPHDPALLAQLLTPPSLSRLMRDRLQFPLEAVAAGRRQWLQTVGEGLRASFSDLYQRLRQKEGMTLGERQLLNRLLVFLVVADPEQYAPWAISQLLDSKRMSLQMGAMGALVHVDHLPCFDEGISIFYDRWQHEPLLMNKWFSIQVAGESSGFSRAQKLIQHPQFDWLNPNRSRSVVGSFSQNWVQFHTSDAYQWMATQLLELDSKNPLLAARLGTCFQAYPLLNHERQEGMAGAMTTILSAQSLSNNLYEVVSKIKNG